MTLSMEATHYGDIKHIDLHAYYGLLMAKSTHKFLK